MSRRVDYERTAGAYRRARTLPTEVLARWTEAVVPFADGRVARVLDLGAGTGQFVGPLAEWFGAEVVAIEPSAAMRAEIEQSERATVVAGTAEHLPIRTAAVDVAWLSTVVHQFEDRATAIGHLRRVVRAGGRVLVRGFFADQAITGLLAVFPGIDRVATTFPHTQEIVADFVSAGFTVLDTVDVIEPWRFEPGRWVERARSMRHTDSAFRPLTDAEFEAGLAAFHAAHGTRTEPIVSEATLRLIVFG